MHKAWWAAIALAAIVIAQPVIAQQQYNERPASFTTPTAGFDYSRRVVDIPMRDGVKLHTVILIPKGAKDAPILMTRTPYNAEGMAGDPATASMEEALQGYDNAADVIARGGYIRVLQDVRGKYGSEGIYMMNPPLHGTALNPTKTDDSTDTSDTIDWLVKNLPESNGKVGILGISYDGFTSLMPLIDPNPALKVAVPMNPMVDGWRGDDWFHNGAFRETMLPYIWEQEATPDNSAGFTDTAYDDYDVYLRAGSAGAIARAHGLDQVGFWRKIHEHPAYDSFWQDQAMDRILAHQPLKVPTMIVAGQWDQEDIYGAMAVYAALEPKDVHNDMVYLSLGPWYHGQEIGDGSALGAIKFGSDTAKWWRWHVLAPFLAHYLKGDAMDVAPVTAYRTGTDQWQQLKAWPIVPDKAETPLYLKPGGALGFSADPSGKATISYISDPAHPVPYRVRPVVSRSGTNSTWRRWLVDDQRGVSARPDVLTFTSGVLTQPVTIAGQPVVHLSAATTGTDADWVVKLIDVYPDRVPDDEAMGGYELAVAMDIFRGRYRESLAEPHPIPANTPETYSFALPNANHVFLPGHRIMVQVQSSWFPLYDRNPQTFVPNIFDAKPADYVTATQSVTVSGPDQSRIDLPVVK